MRLFTIQSAGLRGQGRARVVKARSRIETVVVGHFRPNVYGPTVYKIGTSSPTHERVRSCSAGQNRSPHKVAK